MRKHTRNREKKKKKAIVLELANLGASVTLIARNEEAFKSY